ncbi:ABC transporter permease subunit [Streptomyces sp. NBC_01728]|uniref:ABC transporter permease n=1 Tax=unclassified Streptomyces TaxID=2593676 RepID=UPI0022556F26|nr:MULTISPECIES: ABC transporter permease subunit [unclassified Streptomyces]MCX4460782.1 ABC transporter permease subunit [Streptomyces sp. NBC_01719]MCX4499888.1 ABC transporter permease subunit [Streptomyces sp. NBC_01728]
MTVTLAKETTGPPPVSPVSPVSPAERARRSRRRARIVALLFVFPALLLLGALVVYPVLFSVGRSFFDASGTRFVGGDNYTEMFRDPATLKAVRNTAIWVVVAPTLLTGLGLVLAVLVEKVRWATAFKLLLFMPMAVSFLAAGIIFRLAYDDDPSKGVLNAAVVGVHDAFKGTSAYPTARARDGHGLTAEPDGSYRTSGSVPPGSSVEFGMVGVAPDSLPGDARSAYAAAGRKAAPDEANGVVYLDFTPGGGGQQGKVDRPESGLPKMRVDAVGDDGRTVASTTTASDGSFHFSGLKSGSYTVKLPGSNFAQPYQGISWLGPALVTPAIIGAYLWIWTGFAMALIGAGLSTLPRDALEAARMDGANEWQIFLRITVPLLAPVLTVVFVTLVINVMKVFDLVYIIAPGPVQEDATVHATQMWLVSFGGGNNQGLGSALGVLLLLVIPAMVFNVRRFRRSQR